MFRIITREYMVSFSKIKKITGACLLGGLVISVVMFSTSCKHGGDYIKQTKTLDSLTSLVHKADSTLTVVDTATIKKCANHVMESLQLIKMAHKDSMSKGAAEIFRNFSSVRWQLETFMGRRAVMMIEMRKSVDQLTHLSHDLKLDLIKADSVPIYYGAEVKKATLLIESEKIGVQTLNAQLPLYYLIAPQADSLIALVKAHKEI
ncbi:MAG TPA: hypothetical protein VN922_21995 [Bacteroidia bacterium]|nr:hypothetical protein [Bacteroidia bacterium]